MRYITISFKGDKIGSAEGKVVNSKKHYLDPEEKQEVINSFKNIQAYLRLIELNQKNNNIASWLVIGILTAIFILIFIK